MIELPLPDAPPAAPKRARLASSCSEAMKEYVTAYAKAAECSEGQLIREALAQYCDYILLPDDQEPAPRVRTPKQTQPKRKLEIDAALEAARARRAERLANQ